MHESNENETNELQGLRIISPTDRRAEDDWACDDEFCHQFLLHVTATHPEHEGRAAVWKTAIQRYWRDRCSRRELADELQITVEAIKSLLTLIRKAAEKFKTDGHAGFNSNQTITVEWPGRVHSTITVNDIYRIVDGDREAIAHAEEYGRLTLRSQTDLFDPTISPQLKTILAQPEIDAADVARANALKASVAKDDQFEGRPLLQNFIPYRPNYRADGRGRPRKVLTFIRTSDADGIFLDAQISQHLEGTMNHKQAAARIKQHDIPRSTVARLCKMHLPDLSGWLNGRTDISQDKIERITQVITDITKMIQVMPMKVDLTDCENVAKLIVAVNDAEMQLEMFAPESATDIESLRVRPA